MEPCLDNYCKNNNKSSNLIIVTLWVILSFCISLVATNSQESTCSSYYPLLCSEASVNNLLSEINNGETESDSNDHIRNDHHSDKLHYHPFASNYTAIPHRLIKWLKPLQQAPPRYSSFH